MLIVAGGLGDQATIKAAWFNVAKANGAIRASARPRLRNLVILLAPYVCVAVSELPDAVNVVFGCTGRCDPGHAPVKLRKGGPAWTEAGPLVERRTSAGAAALAVGVVLGRPAARAGARSEPDHRGWRHERRNTEAAEPGIPRARSNRRRSDRFPRHRGCPSRPQGSAGPLAWAALAARRQPAGRAARGERACGRHCE